MDGTRLLNVREAAARLGLPVAWLRREADSRRIPALRVGRRLMFDLNALTEALARRQREGVGNA
jgi:excisionase family DNA binding protein